MQYTIRRAKSTPEIKGLWDGAAWKHANIASIDQFRAESSDHRPKTLAKLLYDDSGLYAHFRVDDQYVVCTRTKNQELTSKDSCVEVYIEPVAEGDWDRVTSRTDD